MSEELERLRNEIKVEAAGSVAFEVEAFARVYARRLEDAEQVYDLNVESLHCVGPRGRRLGLLGYAEDTTEQSLVLLAGRYFGEDATLTMTEAREVLGRATGFLQAALDGWLGSNLEISSRESEYADYFATRVREGRVAKIRVILITDGVMSTRIRTIDGDVIEGLSVSYEVWDQKRLLDAALPERGSEDIDIDFTKWLPGGLPCLVADTHDATTKTYLAVIPGKILAEVFEEYGSLLLESNVRTFLSARGAVNRGIQATLAQEPGRFLAYNNGLTTTAGSVEVSQSEMGQAIRRVARWQIVNGGQTTASIVHYLRGSKARNVDEVFVQMKLVTVSAKESAGVVHSVARYANSQNRISGADLFTTHEFHVRMEQISRRLRAPAQEGKQYHTGWYYERARGQWENDRAASGAASEQAKFELVYPKSQRITKTDWAKYAFCWSQKPHAVSKGAQSVFVEYALKVDELWEKDANLFGDAYFRTNVAKAIMYESLRSAVMKQEWYAFSPGYLANIVAYGMSRFAFQLERQFPGSQYDWERSWQRQATSPASLAALIDFARAAQRHLTDPGRPQANVTQWAKQLAAWEAFQRLPLRLPSAVEEDLLDVQEVRAQSADARKQRAVDTGFENVQRVMKVTTENWQTILRSKTEVPLSPTESDLVQVFGVSHRERVPSDRQAAALLRVLRRMAEYGAIPPDCF